MSECEHIDLVKEYNTYFCPHCGVYFEMVLVSELVKQIAAGVEIIERAYFGTDAGRAWLKEVSQIGLGNALEKEDEN